MLCVPPYTLSIIQVWMVDWEEDCFVALCAYPNDWQSVGLRLLIDEAVVDPSAIINVALLKDAPTETMIIPCPGSLRNFEVFHFSRRDLVFNHRYDRCMPKIKIGVRAVGRAFDHDRT